MSKCLFSKVIRRYFANFDGKRWTVNKNQRCKWLQMFVYKFKGRWKKNVKCNSTLVNDWLHIGRPWPGCYCLYFIFLKNASEKIGIQMRSIFRPLYHRCRLVYNVINYKTYAILICHLRQNLQSFNIYIPFQMNLNLQSIFDNTIIPQEIVEKWYRKPSVNFSHFFIFTRKFYSSTYDWHSIS